MKYIFLLIFSGLLGYFIFFGIFNEKVESPILQSGSISQSGDTILNIPPESVLKNQIHKEKCGENQCFVNNTCVPLPLHGECNEEKKGIISSKDWSCKAGYKEVENTCVCETGNYVCTKVLNEVSAFDTNIQKLEGEINSFILDQNDESSVLKYNSLVDVYNKSLDDRNKFMNEKCLCEGGYNFKELFNK